jgi:hypothetical protein
MGESAVFTSGGHRGHGPRVKVQDGLSTGLPRRMSPAYELCSPSLADIGRLTHTLGPEACVSCALSIKIFGSDVRGSIASDPPLDRFRYSGFLEALCGIAGSRTIPETRLSRPSLVCGSIKCLGVSPARAERKAVGRWLARNWIGTHPPLLTLELPY